MWEDKKYFYESTVERIIDADTIDVSIDLGLKVFTTQRLRFARIDAWETRGEEREQGLEAKDYVRMRIPEGSTVFIQTIKDRTGRYGRYLAEIFYIGAQGLLVNLNDELLGAGHAELY